MDQVLVRIPPLVKRLGWVSLFGDVCSEFVYPVIPLFLVGALRAPAWALGLSEGLSDGISSFLKGYSGYRLDRTGRARGLIRLGYLLSTAGKPILALAGYWPTVVFGRSLDRVGKGMRTTPRDVLIAAECPPDSRGAIFGFHRSMDTAGALAGVLLALAFLWLWPGEYRVMFLLAAIPGIVSVALVWPVRDPEPPPGPRPVGVRDAWSRLPPSYRWALGLWMLFSVANSSDTFLLLRGRELGLSDMLVVLAYAAYNVTSLLASYPAGAISDRLGRGKVCATAWAVYAVAYAGFAYATTGTLWGWFLLYGLAIGLSQAVGRAWVVDDVAPEVRGTALGLFHMGIGVATVAGGLVAGLLWTIASPRAALLTDAALALLAAALAAGLLGRRPDALRPQG